MKEIQPHQQAVVDELLEGLHAAQSVGEMRYTLASLATYVDGLCKTSPATVLVYEGFRQGDGTKIAVIKTLRSLLPGLGLKEAKAFAEGPTRQLCLSSSPEYVEYCKALRAVGALIGEYSVEEVAERGILGAYENRS